MSEATQYAAETASAQPTKPTSFWEDVIEIFIHPADVYRRRANTSVWPPMLFVTIAVGIIGFATFNTLSPIFEAEFARNTAKAVAANPQAAASMEKMKDFTLNFGKFMAPVFVLIAMFILGIFTWLLSKIVSAKTTFNQALVVAAWAYFPRILGAILGGVQGLLMDPSKLNSQLAISIGPARFFNVDTTNPLLYQVLGRFDLITIWVTILLAVGVYVTGKITKNQAVAFGVIIFIAGALPAIRNGYMMM